MTKETAEQKLLKALQKKTGASSVSTKKSSDKAGFKFALSIFDLNKILLVAIIACAALLVLQLRSGMDLLRQEVDFSGDLKSSDRRDDTGIAKPKDVKYYTDAFGKRNIFKPYDINLGKAAQATPNLAKRLSKYKLVGVAWLDLPESVSVMIEDTDTKTTHFLKTGEQLEGVTVKTVYTDRVVFSYENEETTIKL